MDGLQPAKSRRSVRVEEMHPWVWYTIVTVIAVGFGVWLTWGVDPGYDGRAPLTYAPYDW